MHNIVILAAGKGTRMRSALPKVLQPIANRPMLDHVIRTSLELNPNKIIVVVGHGGERVIEYCQNAFSAAENLYFCSQEQQLGTADAVKTALPLLDDHAHTVVLYGDTPLVSADQIQTLLDSVSKNQLALLTATLDDPSGYGRVIARDGFVKEVIEHKDANNEQRAIKLINTGMIAAHATHLHDWLPLINNNNKQGEYYLPDIISIANDHGAGVQSVEASDLDTILGVNDKLQLAQLERIYQRQQTHSLMQQGATLIDPARVDVRGSVQIGQDVSIDVNVVFQGNVSLGNDVHIEPNCIIADTHIQDGAVIHANSILEGAEVGQYCSVGPFARLRTGTKLMDKSKIGNFVETKQATLGEHSKANHFTYLGDATVGRDVNIGAGTITCNYDGANKHQTMIGDNVFVGSNTSLIAPINVGNDATIGAGSTLSGDIDAQGLTLTRTKKRFIANWHRPIKKR